MLEHTAPRPPLAGDDPVLVAALTQRAADALVLSPPPGAFGCAAGPAPVITLPLDAEQPDRAARCACGGAAERCRWTLWAIDSALGAVASPEATVVGELERRLGVPRWSRELELLADALAPDTAGVPPDAEPSWLVRADVRGELSLVSVWARRFRRKPGFRTWTGPAAGRHPADRAATDQLRLLDGTGRVEPLVRRGVVLRALEALVGHPRVLWALDGGEAPERLQVRSAEVGLALGLGEDPETLALTAALDGRPWPREQVRRDVLDHAAADRTAWLDGDLFVAQLSEAAERLLRLVVDRGPRYPVAALGTLVDRLPQFEVALPVHILPEVLGSPVPAEARLQVQLAWQLPTEGPETLRLRLRVLPLPGARPRRPGLGPARALGRVHGGPAHAYRDRAAERAAAVEVLEALGLSVPTGADARWQWELTAPEPALDTVLAIDALQGLQRPHDVVWEGPRPTVHPTAAAAALSVAVRPGTRRGWFQLDGALSVDAAELALAELLDQARRGWQHVRLGPGQWVQLSEVLRARLTELAAVARGPGGTELPGFSGAVVDDLSELGVAVDADVRWARLRERARAAVHHDVQPPPGLRCTLRPYQRRGFEWLVRLTAWGAGGVLADDMGLGKTVQALALLLHRAADGAALVVAPSSLVFNWRDEARRFAPSLDVRVYRGPDRATLLRGLGPGGVLLSTYDIVARDVSRLAELSFATLVLDEAHAIKNADSQRARAVRRLQAGARVALTGTPIENRLEELWSLMDGVCPGLLGARQAFVEDFVHPIEGDADAERQAALSRIIRPFVLRRLKTEVAPELPARVMVVRRIPARPDHAGHYARERERAIAETRQLVASEADGARLRVLAWITRLRMLASHPGLVDPGWTTGSAKLDHALELLESLHASGHATLVFSQFTRHLDLVQAGLERLGLRWCRIDGSTAPARRAEAVRGFQAGEADVFLLSLKAGGVGLNLTAADHVVLLDPWWNPAAEDQAADRAHRIGQERPVTITRLVTAGTLEDDILALQADKRALVAATLSGTGSAGRLDGAALATLIQGSDQLRSDLRAEIPSDFDLGLTPPGAGSAARSGSE